MIRVSWMWRHSPPIREDQMSLITQELEDFGYYSILFPIKSTNADYLPQIANSITTDQKIKYMIPIRPYLLSPQYLAMLSAGIEAIAPKKTIFNFINGHIENDENFDGVIGSSIDFSDKVKRRDHLESFIQILKKIKMHDITDFSEILISGGSKETLDIAKRQMTGLASSYSHFIKNYDFLYSSFNFKTIYLQTCIFINDSSDLSNQDIDISDLISKNPSGIIHGSYQEIINEIKKLESMGVTDLLISNAFDGGKTERLRIHKLISKLMIDGHILKKEEYYV